MTAERFWSGGYLARICFDFFWGICQQMRSSVNISQDNINAADDADQVGDQMALARCSGMICKLTKEGVRQWTR